LRFEIPDSSWYCNRCKVLKENPEMEPDEIKCNLCTEYKGVMTKIKDNKYDIKWAHPICVLWNPSIKYESSFNKDKIFGEPKIGLLDTNCVFCETCEGSLISCDFIDCNNSFHVKCAVQQHLLRDYIKMVKMGHVSKENSNFVAVFCKDHLSPGLKIMNQDDPSLRENNLKERKTKNPFIDIDRLSNANNIETYKNKSIDVIK
jgi:hypothetical protein